MLPGRVYRSLVGIDWLNCIRSCHEDPKCLSYNFVRSTDDGQGECQMIDCGLDDVCFTETLVFSSGAVFQQIVETKFDDTCNPLSKRNKPRADFNLYFPSPGLQANYVQGRRIMRHLNKLSVCFWVKSTKDQYTVFSYLGRKGKRELTLEIRGKDVLFTLGEEQRSISVPANDGKWHHFCALWSNTDGAFAFFKDGEVKRSLTQFQESYVIASKGNLVLGQEQTGNNIFDPSKSFEGELDGFNIWSRNLTAIEVLKRSKNCRKGRGDVIKWSKFAHGIKGIVKVVSPSTCVP
ncbi:neuronal pentraxin-1-like isoform X1 [Montipora capricornis]|uniref:neuronal pentraxin-1-like isoform X1 n=1 Tax=Montipora capricornis TaxID=246305 RepID=UPI0035F1E9E1